jgi:hypothetical protein
MGAPDTNTIPLWAAVITGGVTISVMLVTRLMASRSVNIAVLAEIQRLLKVLERHKAWWERSVKSGDTFLPLVAFSTPVFDQQVKTIGNVDRRVVAKVVAFYGYVKLINAIKSEKPKYFGKENEEKFNIQYAEILTRVLHDFDGEFDDAFRSYGLL